jgi:hypothetical protein
MQPPASCHVCAVPLTAAHLHTAPLCGGAECHARSQATPAWRRCGVCARPLADRALAERVCGDAACRHEWLVERPRQRRLELDDRARRFRAAAAAHAGVDAPETFPVGLVPRLRPRLTRLPDRRRRALAAHLTTLAREAAALRARGTPPDRASTPVPPRAELAAVLGHACGRCRGFCCMTAGDLAYLQVGTLHRWLDAHPDRDANAAVAAYLAYLGPRTVHRSCPFHRADGCSLPRDMRADICNSYICDGLTRISDAAPAAGPVHAFVATMNDPMDATSAFITGAFVDARDVRVVHRRRTASEETAGTSRALRRSPFD